MASGLFAPRRPPTCHSTLRQSRSRRPRRGVRLAAHSPPKTITAPASSTAARPARANPSRASRSTRTWCARAERSSPMPSWSPGVARRHRGQCSPRQVVQNARMPSSGCLRTHSSPVQASPPGRNRQAIRVSRVSPSASGPPYSIHCATRMDRFRIRVAETFEDRGEGRHMAWEALAPATIAQRPDREEGAHRQKPVEQLVVGNAGDIVEDELEVGHNGPQRRVRLGGGFEEGGHPRCGAPAPLTVAQDHAQDERKRERGCVLAGYPGVPVSQSNRSTTARGSTASSSVAASTGSLNVSRNNASWGWSATREGSARAGPTRARKHVRGLAAAGVGHGRASGRWAGRRADGRATPYGATTISR